MNDFYKTLEVDRIASQEVIKAAYRVLAKKYHPDKNSSNNAIKKMQDINMAYEVLSREDLKKEYDKRLIEANIAKNVINEKTNNYQTKEPSGYSGKHFKEDRVEVAASEKECSVNIHKKNKKPILNLFIQY